MAEAPRDCNREIRGQCKRGLIAGSRLAPLRNGLFRVRHFTPKVRTVAFATESTMPKTPEELFAFLDTLGIEVSDDSHPPLFTVADQQALRGEIAGGHTKNLFLKDKKDNYFLVTVDEEAEVDLKQIHI